MDAFWAAPSPTLYSTVTVLPVKRTTPVSCAPGPRVTRAPGDHGAENLPCTQVMEEKPGAPGAAAPSSPANTSVSELNSWPRFVRTTICSGPVAPTPVISARTVRPSNESFTRSEAGCSRTESISSP